MTEINKQACGIVKSFNPVKGFGFISCDDILDEDVYFHFSQILMEGRRVLSIGDRVEFLYKPFEDKGLRAYRVRKIKDK